MMTPKRLSFMAALATLLLSAPAWADGVIVELDVQITQVNDASFDLVESDDYLSSISVGGGYELSGILPGLSVLGLFQSSVTAVEQGERLGRSPLLEWSQQRFMVAAEYGPELFGFLRPFARVGAGYALQNLTLNTSDGALFDYAHDLAGFGALGAELFVPTTQLANSPDTAWLSKLKVGLHGQYGYTLQSTAQFDELRASQDVPESDPWQRDPVNVGSLSADGMFWSFGALARWSF